MKKSMRGGAKELRFPYKYVSIGMEFFFEQANYGGIRKWYCLFGLITF